MTKNKRKQKKVDMCVYDKKGVCTMDLARVIADTVLYYSKLCN